MTPFSRFVVVALFGSALFSIPSVATAKTSSWTDAKGASFRGEPIEALGPFALFRTGGGSGRRVPFRAMSEADCRRFAEEIAGRAPRAATLAEAKGAATSDLIGRVQHLVNRKLVAVDATTLPEPELVLVLVGSHNDGEGWAMVGNMLGLHQRVQRVYPGLMQTVFLGTRHNAAEHREMAEESWMPYLVADFNEQRAMVSLARFIPAEEGTNMVLVTREGVPLAAARAVDLAAMRAFSDQVMELLATISPDYPPAWGDRLRYLKIARPVQFAHGHADPVLVGDPLRADALRQYGVKKVRARLDVAADGKVAATLQSGPDEVPAALAGALQAALTRAVVAPAIDQGQPAAGALEYVLEVPTENQERAADLAWIGSTTYPVLPIERWLVLRPIGVPEKEFEGGVQGVTESGTVILKSLEVNSGKVSRAAQLSAFNSDFFGEAGPGSVQPKAGDRQKIDDQLTLAWDEVRSKDGLVDMQTGLSRDYVVGYAWTEFESPVAGDALLGLGSDDGVKIWLNGQLVHDKWIRRPSRIDDDVVPLHLAKGPNRILIKIQNATGDWSFYYRLRLKPGK